MIHAKMTKPRKVAPKAAAPKTAPTTKTAALKAAAPKTAPTANTPIATKMKIHSWSAIKGKMSPERRARVDAKADEIANRLGTVAKGLAVGTVVEVLIDGSWWPAKVDRAHTDCFHVALFPGAPPAFALIATHGGTWRIANRLHSVPLTRQGVRNLDMAAPPRFRNGRRFRKPKHFEAICSHPEEALAEEPIEEEVEGLDENRQLFTYVLRFLECGDCGAEISI